MQLYLALSCLQGRPMQSAFDELTELQPAGIQLTPGNAPTYGFEEHVTKSGSRRMSSHRKVSKSMQWGPTHAAVIVAILRP